MQQDDVQNGGITRESDAPPRPTVTVEPIATENNTQSSNGTPQAAEKLHNFSPREVKIVFVGLASSVFLASLDATVVSTILSAIVSDLKGSVDDYTWIVGSFLLANSAVLPLYGKLSDVFGRRAMLLIGIGLFLLGSVLCAVAPNPTGLVGARAVQGIGAGGLMPMVITVISDITTLQERAKYQGLIGAVFGLSSVLGPIIGGGLTDSLSWRYAFYLNVPFTMVSLFIVYKYLIIPLPKTNMREKIARIDFLGSITIVGAVCALVLATNWGGSTYAWDSPQIIACLVVAGVLFVVFTVVEYYFAAEPNIPAELFTYWNFNAALLSAFGLGGAMFSAVYFIPLYHETVFHDSATTAGLKLIPVMVGFVGCSITSGVIISKKGNYAIFPKFGAILLPLGLGLYSLLGTSDQYGQEFVFSVIAGAGMGLTLQPGVLAMQHAIPRRLYAAGNSTLIFFRFIAGVIALAIYFAVYKKYITDNFDYHHVSDTLAGATRKVFQTSLAFALLMSIGNLLIRQQETNRENNPNGSPAPPATMALE